MKASSGQKTSWSGSIIYHSNGVDHIEHVLVWFNNKLHFYNEAKAIIILGFELWQKRAVGRRRLGLVR